jgi:hypothetical protein
MTGPPVLRCRAPIQTVGGGRGGPTTRRERVDATGSTSLFGSGGLPAATTGAVQLPPPLEHIAGTQKWKRSLASVIGWRCETERQSETERGGLGIGAPGILSQVGLRSRGFLP